MNINKELAEVMEYTVDRFENGAAICFSEYSNVLGGCETRIIDYRDPAIFAECVKWLLDNGCRIECSVSGHYVVTFPMKDISTLGGCESDKDLFKAAVLARIEAGKQ